MVLLESFDMSDFGSMLSRKWSLSYSVYDFSIQKLLFVLVVCNLSSWFEREFVSLGYL